ncbi:MAG: hypothetical protein Q7S68_06060 [Deltaproteobacteria bacterium]|nr:hypothetical protein [Deltaproteobacteria bacterium]
MVFIKSYYVSTTEELDVVDIIHDVRFTIHDSKIVDGLAMVSLPGAEGALQIAPQNQKEELRKNWKDSLFVQTSVAIPFEKTELKLEPKQTLFLIDANKAGKRREIFVQILGEAPQQPQQPPAGQRRNRR